MSENKNLETLNKVDASDLENVSGGLGCNYGGWVYGTVHDVVYYDSSSCLTLRSYPGGDVMYTNAGQPMGWQNGESILVQPASRQGDWVKAQYGSVIGWTNANYVWY